MSRDLYWTEPWLLSFRQVICVTDSICAPRVHIEIGRFFVYVGEYSVAKRVSARVMSTDMSRGRPTFEGNDKVKGGGGNDIITTGIGKDKAWGGPGDDLFVTENNGEGFVRIMDFEVGDRIEFCGCLSTRIEMRGKNAYIMKGDDIKAVVKGVDAEDLELDFDSKMIFISPDPLA